MFDSIHIGTSGLQAFSTGLKVISNNVANLNTPGFKAGDAQFSNLFYLDAGGSATPSGGQSLLFGTGVMAGQTFVNFKVGEARQTGNPLDVSISGEGFFVTREEGHADTVYTRAGEFEFNDRGVLVVRGTTRRVIGLDAGHAETSISLEGLRIKAPTPTSTVSLAGNLSSSATEFTLEDVGLVDATGEKHAVNLNFKPKIGQPNTWTVTLLDGITEVGSGEIAFIGGRPVTGSDGFSVDYAPAGVENQTVKFDFSTGVSSFDTGTTSSLSVGSSDGKAVGSLTGATFDTDGGLKLAYSNGETVRGARIALARFDTTSRLAPIGSNGFSYGSSEGIQLGRAGDDGFGSITSNQLEGSNVDLAGEFSDLIVAQRGYQASSRVVSTANDMLQELVDLKGRR